MSILAAMRTASAVSTPPMVDLSFALSGERLPHGYAFALEAALVEALPWLGADESSGVHPIKAPLTDLGLVLSRRSRLVLRIPADRVGDAGRLAGQTLAVGAGLQVIGALQVRPIEPFATLQAWNVVTGAADEPAFLDDIAFQLEVLGVRAKLICGRLETLDDGARRMKGFGLALHELSPGHSVLLQSCGLGMGRGLGCGVFVPHKIIEGLGTDPE